MSQIFGNRLGQCTMRHQTLERVLEDLPLELEKASVKQKVWKWYLQELMLGTMAKNGALSLP
jgi:hypothetical protein